MYRSWWNGRANKLSETGRLSDITALMARRLRCPGCMRRFRTQDISTIESSARKGVFKLHCPMCHSHRLVIAVWQRNVVRTYGTDLDSEEWHFYRNAPSVSTDDVIRISQVMSEYKGDLSDVLEDPLFDDQE